MRRFFSIFLSFIICFSLLNFNIYNVSAENPHEFSLIAYDCNELNEDYECMGPNSNPEEELNEILTNGDVEPGKILKLGIYYVPGDTTDISMQIGVMYDNSLVEPVYDGEEIYVETDMSTTYYGGIWPAAGTTTAKKKITNWQVLYNDDVDNSTVKFIVQDSTNSAELKSEGVLAYMFFKVKDTASAGEVISFSFDDTYTKLAKKSARTLKNATFNVFGEMSTNTALDTLTVKNGTTLYTLDPEFVSGSTENKNFNVIVPNQITTVDISATPSDLYSVVASGTGTQSIDVGNNTINMIVQAQNGVQETYTINVYRLSNDATLKTLTLSNNVNIGTFTSTNTSYTALVPYSTSETNVSATVTHSNAKIISGTGKFSLTNYGDTVNTRNIVVNAENCDSTYSSVPDNTCTTKTYKIDITRTSPSTNANLSDIMVDGTTIENFESGITTYNLPNVANDVTSLNLNAIVEDTGKAKIISSLGTKTLNVGDNNIVITVQAEDGSTKDYTLNVRRLSNDSKLASLVVTSNPLGTLSPTFSSTFYNYYTYTAPSTVDKVTISATVNDTVNAQIVSGLGEYSIDTTPSVSITVQAEDGSTSIYVVKLVRSKSSNNNLSSLSLDGYTLNETFSPSTTLYTANVSGEVTSVDVSATVEDTGKAQIISGLGTHNLNVGTNNIQVRVQAENGTTKDYTITVTRAKKTISTLTDLKVDGVTVTGFNESILEYTLNKVSFEKTSVEISATLKDSDSTVTGTGTVSLKTGSNKLYVTVTAQDGVTQTPYIINIERAKDDNAYLSDIQIDGTSIENFNKETYDYNLTVDNSVTKLNLNAVKESTSATVSITGNSDFVTTANNVVQITVTSESGNIKIYTINVTREKSSNNYLKSITLSSGLLNPVFDKTQNNYTVDVDRSVTSINITPVLDDAKSTYNIVGPSELSIGSNTFTITVTSENGNNNIYTIIVNRNPSSNNYLSNLTVDGQTVTGFNKDTTLYRIDVDSTKSSVTIEADALESHATVSGTGTYLLDTGVNTFSIVVTAENGDQKTYSVVVNRAQSNDNYLSSLSVAQSTITPTFNKDVLEYKSAVAYTVTDIDILATANDTKATITGTGSKQLNTGDNVFEIVVTAEDNTKRTYKLTVTRAKNDNANLSNIVISGGFTLAPTFSADTTSYNLLVPNSADNLTITAYKQDPAALSIEGDGVVNLNTGMNEINIVVTAENGVTKKTYTLNIEREKSNDATLSSLTLDNGTLSPSFDKDITEYEVIVPYEIENLGITAVTSSDAAETNINGNSNLVVGTNTATITVTAEDGSLNVYTIKILRQPSTNNFLSTLSVKDINNKEYIDVFLKTKMDYSITVENDIEKVIIDGTTESSTSRISGLGEKSLEIGDNSFEITVTSESGIERVYAIKVFRKANSNNYLQSLEVEGYNLTPAFDKQTLSYSLTVASTVDTIKINALAEVSTSTVIGTGEFTITTGVNNFNIDVTSENGESKTYVIVINKEASDNNYLTNLSISPGELTPNFSKEVTEYSVHFDNSTKIMNISADAEHSSATVTGTGVKSIVVGPQKFDIEVKAENNEKRVYTINVTRDASSNKDLSDLKINGQTIENFNKDELKYSLNVDNSTDKITVDAIAVDETASVLGTGEINLNTGTNVIYVTVTAEDGSIKVYEITVTRAKSSNNYLKQLTVSEGSITPEFNKDTLSYNISVPYEIETLTINAQTEVNTSTIEIDGNNNFLVGTDNKVYINVVSEDETVRSYVINVTRQPQVNNFLTDIVITDNDGTRYSLSPTFDKTTLNYEVELSSNITEVNIQVTKQQSSLTVTGDGKVNISSFPQTHKIIVTSTGGLERTYTIKFTKGLSTNKYLGFLSVDKGTLVPEFDKYETAYNVDLTEYADDITITATKAEEGQTVFGDGLKTLVAGRNQFKITVTSESGDTNVYTIFVNANGNVTSNVLDSLTVDKGQLTPAFDKDTKLYSVDLDSSETEITITATGKNTITGTGTHSLVEGTNVFEIVTKDSNSSENIYRVVVNRGNITSSYLSDLKIEGYEISPSFDKETYSYSLKLDNIVSKLDVIAIPESKNSNVTITGNDNLAIGDNNINIVVEDENGAKKTYTIKVSIGQTNITSDIHKIEDKYIKTIEEQKSVSEVKNEMTNPKEYLKIYNIDGVELSDGDIVSTGCIIKLIINDKEYDSKTLIIKGDINSDGEVSVADIIKFRLYILETIDLNDNEILAADINDDTSAEVSDLIQIRRHILGNLNLFEKEVE